MNFGSRFGLGEIVSYTRERDQKITHDELLEVVAITFQIAGFPMYTVRGHRGQLLTFGENELEGDPDFDQEKGYEDANR